MMILAGGLPEKEEKNAGLRDQPSDGGVRPEIIGAPGEAGIATSVEPPESVDVDNEKIRNGEQNNSEIAPASLAIEPYEMIGRVGRQRKYEERGNRGELPIKQLVLYRYKLKRQIPGLSDDMERWYEFFYFTKPDKGKDGDKYEQHARAYKRGRKWITDERAVSLGSRSYADTTARG
jgi:hypothetical protein